MTLLLASLPLAHATNILFIVADDLGSSNLNGFTDPGSTAYYLPDTPNLDNLRAAGISFTNAWSNPECSPTRAGLHTGNPAYLHGVGRALSGNQEEDYQIADKDWETLAETFSSNGVDTAAFGKWHIGTPGSHGYTDWSLTASDPDTTVSEKPHPVRAGFDSYVGDPSGIVKAYDGWSAVYYPGSGGAGNSDLMWMTDNVDDVVVDEAIAWINAEGASPWFAMVNFSSPHSTKSQGPYEAADYDASCPDPGVVVVDEDGDGSTDDDEEKQVYKTLIECTDRRIGTLLGGITTTILEDTVIVFIGDNGTPAAVLEGDYADPGSRTDNGKGSVYETGVRVPMITTDGGTWLQVGTGAPLTSDVYPNPGDTYDNGVTTTDMHDTVLNLMEITSGLTTYSQNLAGVIAAGSFPARPVIGIYTEIFNPDWATGGLKDTAAAAFKSGSWKIVLDVDRGGTCIWKELYDLSKDPYERNDLASSNTANLNSLYNAVVAKGVPWLPTTPC